LKELTVLPFLIKAQGGIRPNLNESLDEMRRNVPFSYFDFKFFTGSALNGTLDSVMPRKPLALDRWSISGADGMWWA
jgi:hypothetical protein